MLIELGCHHPDPAKPWEKVYSLNGTALTLARSLAVCNHSQSFNHGFGGSGPAQLALAICLELFSRPVALSFYHDFKWEHIATLGQHGESEAQEEAFTALLDVTKYADRARSLPAAGPLG